MRFYSAMVGFVACWACIAVCGVQAGAAAAATPRWVQCGGGWTTLEGRAVDVAVWTVVGQRRSCGAYRVVGMRVVHGAFPRWSGWRGYRMVGQVDAFRGVYSAQYTRKGRVLNVNACWRGC
jgi:hypothetical protein